MKNHIKKELNIIINEVDTRPGRLFDILLIISISISSLLIILDSIPEFHFKYGYTISSIQTVFLFLFSLEYILRIIIAENKLKYITSFYGIVDFLAIFPIYFSFIFNYGSYFPIIRVLRLLRLFSVFKMGRYISESGALLRALKASREKITVFIFTIFFIIIIVGALMYTIEGPENGFISIPESMYWTVVTISTVGYGDISPQTNLGKILASGLMIVGYGIIAVPTGIITSELSKDTGEDKKHITICKSCGAKKHRKNSSYCYNCGNKL